MFTLLKRHYCRAHMIAYLNGDLSPRARRRIATFIDTDEVCYAEYRRQRDALHNTREDIRALGIPAMPRLEHIWSSVDAELGRPMRPETHKIARVGIVAVLLGLVLVMPFAMSSAAAASQGATQPSPRILVFGELSTRTAQTSTDIIRNQAIDYQNQFQQQLKQQVQQQLSRPVTLLTAVPPVVEPESTGVLTLAISTPAPIR